MNLCWICPTWNRPKCLANLVRQFLSQEYDRGQLELVILDDAQQYTQQFGGEPGRRWYLFCEPQPFKTLPEKYNALLKLAAPADAVIVAEDDDEYHPLHTAACAAALEHGEWCKPSRVRSDFAPQGEPADGRFHASLAFRREWLLANGGWPDTSLPDFDQQLIRKLTKIEPPVDPLRIRQPGLVGTLMRRTFPMTYKFCWGSTQHSHAQASARTPADQDWLERARTAAGKIHRIDKLLI